MPTPNSSTTDTPDKGQLQINLTSEVTAAPIPDASISISYTGVPDSQLEQLTTDSSGQTETIDLEAPPLEYSLDPENEIQPYAEYTIDVTAPGYEPVSVAGAEILPTIKALQNIRLRPVTGDEGAEEVFVIPAHTLYGTYPPKIPEDEIKPVTETGEIVLSRVVVPEFIVVHDGSPRDSTAKNYYVKYKDYIKNVASSEIYATWPANTIRANVLAIMSFTLNRVYTEWYRNKGYDFTITSSTAFDHKWIPERNIYDTISVIVDELFSNYLSRPNVRQPILTQYCDGRQVQCPNWMTFLYLPIISAATSKAPPLRIISILFLYPLALLSACKYSITKNFRLNFHYICYPFHGFIYIFTCIIISYLRNSDTNFFRIDCIPDHQKITYYLFIARSCIFFINNSVHILDIYNPFIHVLQYRFQTT